MEKKLFSILAVFVALTTFLTACGTSSVSTDPVQSTVASTASANSEAASSETASSETTVPQLSGELVVATWAGDPFQSAWQDMFTKFEEETGVKVVMDAIPWENLREKSALELASGSGAYDVLYVHPSWFEEFADNGYLIPSEELISKEVIDTFVPSLLDAYRKDGVLYGLPDFITTQTLAYRTDLFEAAGLKAPETWDDILAASEKLADGDNMYGITFTGKKSGALASTFSALLIGNGGWYYDESGKPNINTPEAIDTAAFLGDLSKYAPAGFMNFHWDENANVAASGKAAMAICMTVNSAWLEDPEKSATVGKWGYVPLRSNSGNPGGLIDSYCWSVAKGTKNQEAAAALVSFIADTEAQVYFTEKSGTCGATNEYYENTALLNSTPVLQAMNDTFVNTKPNPSWKTWASQQETLETLLQDVMNGKTTASIAMETLQKQMEAE